jgi:glutamyl-tRNA synthetase
MANSEIPTNGEKEASGERVYRGRYAPSPSGFLHVGNASTALLAWLGAKSVGGKFFLRIEDTDPQRSKPEFAEAIEEDLKWLGLLWDGPAIHQSQRYAAYEEALARLKTEGLLFACRCTRKDLAAAVENAVRAPHAEDLSAPVYPGTCSRLGLPLEGPVVLRAYPEGFPLRRADGAYTYTLAVVVDDAAMGITEVVRGADLEDATPHQEGLFKALGPIPPVYRHVPLWMGPDGHRLSKRHGSVAVRDWRQAGRSAEELVGRLAWGLGMLPEYRPVRPEELLDSFLWEKVRKSPVPASDYLPLVP